MPIVKKGTDEWESLNEASTKYTERLDYEKLKKDLSDAGPGDFIVVHRGHSHRSNLIEGLSRKGLNQKEDYDVSLSYDTKDQPILLVAKLDKPE